VMTTQFWVGLMTIIWVNIILSGDNAVVIALAARSLPAHQQKKAVMYGAGAAVLMRIGLTIVAVELLKYPYLKLIGAVLLLWIAVKLLVPEDDAGDGIESSSNLITAIKTILIADLVMSLDNVIGGAAAAKGSIVLLILGLLISIPLVIFGATILMRLMERFPVIITLGAAILGWVSGEMAATDPVLVAWVDANAAWLHWVAPAAGAIFVVVVGKALAARAEKEHKPVVDLPATSRTSVLAPAAASPSVDGRLKMLISIDGSPASLRAAEFAVRKKDWYKGPVELHLINVQPPMPFGSSVSSAVGHDAVTKYHQDEAAAALEPAMQKVEGAGLPVVQHVCVGDPAEVIASFARERGFDQIIMGTTGTGTASLMLGSVATRTIHLSEVPVLFVK
jgi:YjbE family integral membrane protein